ncbi:hypothetical protein RZE82_08780 [Mollicutes bacterium LVI A0039]|nr:hypothetical protein RZE82_08780 [Mollicutes bacterium LVI A0039]
MEETLHGSWCDFEDRYSEIYNDYNNLNDISEIYQLKKNLNENIYKLEDEFHAYLTKEFNEWKLSNTITKDNLHPVWKAIFCEEDCELSIDNFNYTNIEEMIPIRTKGLFQNVHGSLENMDIIFGGNNFDNDNIDGINKNRRKIFVNNSSADDLMVDVLYIIGHSVIGMDNEYIIRKIKEAKKVVLFYYNNDYIRKLNSIPQECLSKIQLFPIVPLIQGNSSNDHNITDNFRNQLFDKIFEMKLFEEHKNLIREINKVNLNTLSTSKKNLKLSINIEKSTEIKVLSSLLKNSGHLNNLEIKFTYSDDLDFDGDYQEEISNLIDEIKCNYLSLENLKLPSTIDETLNKVTSFSIVNCDFNGENINLNGENLRYAEIHNLINELTVLEIGCCNNLEYLDIKECKTMQMTLNSKFKNLKYFRADVDSLSIERELYFESLEDFSLTTDKMAEYKYILFNYNNIRRITFICSNTDYEIEEQELDLLQLIHDEINYLPNLTHLEFSGYQIVDYQKNLSKKSRNLKLVSDLVEDSEFNIYSKSNQIDEKDDYIEETYSLKLLLDEVGSNDMISSDTIVDKLDNSVYNDYIDIFTNKVKSEANENFTSKMIDELINKVEMEQINAIINEYDSIDKDKLKELIYEQLDDKISKSQSIAYSQIFENKGFKEKREIKNEIYNKVELIKKSFR